LAFTSVTAVLVLHAVKRKEMQHSIRMDLVNFFIYNFE
jgi:hypothetical protein